MSTVMDDLLKHMIQQKHIISRQVQVMLILNMIQMLHQNRSQHMLNRLEQQFNKNQLSIRQHMRVQQQQQLQNNSRHRINKLSSKLQQQHIQVMIRHYIQL